MRLTVIAVEEDDRVVGEALRLELLQHEADLAVEFAGIVEVGRPVLTRDWVIGIDWREGHLCGIGFLRALKGAVRFRKIDLRHERLLTLEVAPLVGVEGLRRIREIPIRLTRTTNAERRWKFADVRREVARVAHPISDRPHPGRHRVAIVAMRAVVVGADGRLIHAGHKRRTRGAADRCRREHPIEAHALRREPVEIRRRHFLDAIAGEVGRKIFADQPEDVRAFRRRRRSGHNHTERHDRERAAKD